MSELVRLLQKAADMEANSILVEKRDQNAHLIVRHSEGVSYLKDNPAILNALERESSRASNSSSDAIINISDDVSASVFRVEQSRWVIHFHRGNAIPSISDMGLSHVHEKSIRLMRTLPYGVRFVCSPDRQLANQLMSTIAIEEAGLHQDKLVVTLDALNSYPVGKFDNLIQFSFSSDVFHKLSRIHPDIVFIEENPAIGRDEFMRGIFDLALSGTQVWCSVASNFAINMIYRVSTSGVSFDLLDTQIISGVIALQRAPKLCEHCSVPFDEHFVEMMQLRDKDYLKYMAFVRFGKAFGENVNSLRFHNHEGCEHCGHDGYQGSLLLAEVLITDPVFFQNIRDGNLIALRHHMDEQGFVDMHRFAKHKVELGELDPFDAEAVVGPMNMDEIMLDSKIMMDKELEHV